MTIVDYIKEVVMETAEDVKLEPRPRYAIGDIVWRANTRSTAFGVPCPDCFGKKKVTVILGDDTEVIIPCVGCKQQDPYGYDDHPTGSITRYQYQPAPETVEIRGVERDPFDHTKIRYNSSLYEGDIFTTKEEAEQRAVKLAKELTDGDHSAFLHKEKRERDWAWHVHYHRGCIKRAKNELAWHEAKLEISLSKKKREKTDG